MKHLPLSLRLFLNILVFSLPIVVLTYLMYDSQAVNIKFGEKERLGIVLQKPYEELMRAVALAKVTGDETGISPSVRRLEEAFGQVAEELQFTSEGLGSRKREAAAFKVLEGHLREKNWDAALQSIKLGIAQLGDTSNLILDPDLDSYYLMDMTLLALPQMQDRVLTIISEAQALAVNPVTVEAQVKAALYAAMLNDSDLQRVIADSQTALNEDVNFYGKSEGLQKNIPLTVKELEVHTGQVLGLLRKLSNGEAVEQESIRTAGLALLNQTYTTWDAAVAELDQVIDVRIQSLSRDRIQSLLMAGLALLFAILFSVIVGMSLSSSIRNILLSVMRLKDTSDESLKIGTHLSDTSRTVSQSLSNQSSAIEQTASSVEEISSMVKNTAENSKEASEVAQMTNLSAVQGESELGRMLSSMNDIVASSARIVETITVIDDIAFQTNLLALNASVEAARAGEQGKGFAVVAEAVRALAQKSAQAAKEINDLVKKNVFVIEQGKKGAEQSAQSLREIISYVRRLNGLIEQIASASAEQNSGIGLISQAINEIEGEASRNQRLMMTVTDSAEALRAQSHQLSLIVNHLEREVLGTRARPSGGPSDGARNKALQVDWA